MYDFFGENLKSAIENFSQMPKAAYRIIPDTYEQIDFIEKFINSKNHSKMRSLTVL